MVWWYGRKNDYYTISVHHGRITQAEAEVRLLGTDPKTRSKKARYLFWLDDDGRTVVSCQYLGAKIDLAFDEKDPYIHNVIAHEAEKWHNNGVELDTKGRDHAHVSLQDAVNIILRNMSVKISKQLLPVFDTTLPEKGFKSRSKKVEWMMKNYGISKKDANECVDISNFAGFGQYMGAEMTSEQDVDDYLELCDDEDTYLELNNVDGGFQYIESHDPVVLGAAKTMPVSVLEAYGAVEGAAEYDYGNMYQTIRYDSHGNALTEGATDAFSEIENKYKALKRSKIAETSFTKPVERVLAFDGQEDVANSDQYLKVGGDVDPDQNDHAANDGHFIKIGVDVDPEEADNQYLDVQPHKDGQGHRTGAKPTSKYEQKSLFVNALQKPGRAIANRNLHVRRGQQTFARLEDVSTIDDPNVLQNAAIADAADGSSDDGIVGIDDDASSLGSGLGFGSDISSAEWSSSEDDGDFGSSPTKIELCKMCKKTVSMQMSKFCVHCDLVYTETRLLNAVIDRNAEEERVGNWWPVAFLKAPKSADDIVEMLKQRGEEAKRDGAGSSIASGSTVRKPVATPASGWDRSDPVFKARRTITDCNNMAFQPDALTLWAGDNVVVHLIQGKKAWGTRINPRTREEKTAEKTQSKQIEQHNQKLQRNQASAKKLRPTYFSHKMLPVVSDVTRARQELREEWSVTEGELRKKGQNEVQKKRWHKYSFDHNPAEFYANEMAGDVDC